ncbi:MAG TPA: hypothetical protein VJH88_04990 [Candidatus Nanoarchaeia archaeon]|nr:hypothetical protein [Candidatus Nanoarchaeia archaeon]
MVVQQQKPVREYVQKLRKYVPPEVTLGEPASQLEKKMLFTDDGKPLYTVDLGKRDDKPDSLLRRMIDSEHWRIVGDFVKGVHNDLPVEAKEVLGLARRAYSALFTSLYDRLLLNPYRPNVKDGWARFG